ncbi:MAG: glycosyltransferase family A protein [Nostocaceae cyanobacterium]|nr:glycosyltransferase family A protein [Nostocaceae cyanobacterium]
MNNYKPHKPRVSIGMPVYNGEKFLRIALDSILTQTFTDFELIILDNASTDKTEEICREYAAKDKRIRYHRNQQNIGAARNFNRAFEISSGDYFKWAAHDDICAATFIEECIQVLDRDETVVVCYPKTKLIDVDGNWTGVNYKPLKKVSSPEPQHRFQDILFHAVWCFEVFGLIRSEKLRKTSLIGKYFGSDKVLLAELSLLGRFQEIEKDLFLRRCSPEQSTNMTVQEKSAWIDPFSQRLIPFQMSALIAYLSAPWKAPLTVLQRLNCILSVLRLVLKLEKWKKILLPGRDNYFGITWEQKNSN